MLLTNLTYLFAIGLVAQALCIFSVLLVRMSERSSYHAYYQCFAMVCLAVLSGCTMLQVFTDNQSWFLGGFTLPLLVIACVVDLKKEPAIRAF